jgi:sterol desaturase/sphingolipid hydroxylase (fatty acid hydroxylase superfamily)
MLPPMVLGGAGAGKGGMPAVQKLLLSSEGKTLFPLLALLSVGNPERLVGWLVENGSVWSLCYLRTFLPHPQRVTSEDEGWAAKTRKVLKNMLICVASNLIAEQGAVLLLYLVSNTLFAHVPPFRANKNRADPAPMSLAGYRDWIQGNGKVQLLGGGVLLGLIESFQPAWTYKELEETPFNVTRFLKNQFWFRLVVDLVFYVGHRAMHANEWLYVNLHKLHHRHHYTSLLTNFNFTAADLFIESVLPVFAAFSFIRGVLGVKMSRFEMHVLLTYTAFHEGGTHLGKPIPVISAFPPLSILYNSIVDIDGRTIEAHEVHHRTRHWNLGITPWLDYVMGTLRFFRPPKASQQPASA